MTNLIRRFALVICILAFAAQASAEVVLLSQSRAVSGYACLWSCSGEDPDIISAPDFGLFEEAISLDEYDSMSWAYGAATQNSEIQTGHLSIHGSASAHGSSDFEVFFEVSTPTPFSMVGTLVRTGVGYSRLRLEWNGELYLTIGAPDGGSDTVVNEEGILEPGAYTLTVSTTFYADADYDYPGSSGSGSFDIDFFLETPVGVDEMAWGQVKALFR